jgi:DNA (cytosine-5)-methyltransferase 1
LVECFYCRPGSLGKEVSPESIKCLDLFSGCGGMSLGLSWSRAGGLAIESIAAIDIWAAACATYERNLGIAPHVDGVSAELVSAVLDDIGSVDLVVGGPPCQGFSTSGKRALSDKRNHLVKSFLDAVELAQPKAFVMENVTGFTTFQEGQLFEEVLQRAIDLGYRVHPGVLLASRFGIPQRRRRFILVGTKAGAFRFPGQIDTDSPLDGPLEVDQRTDAGFAVVSFNEATSDLPRLAAGEQVDRYSKPPQNDFQRWIRAGSCRPSDHVSPCHNPKFVELLSYIPQGKSAFEPEVHREIPKRLRPRTGFANSYARIRGSQPAPTITRNFTTPSSANCIHPRQHRALSLREGARCQSFPDTFEFMGSMSDKRLQIGNAVPPLLAKAIGNALLELCFENR